MKQKKSENAIKNATEEIESGQIFRIYEMGRWKVLNAKWQMNVYNIQQFDTKIRTSLDFNYVKPCLDLSHL